MCIQNTCMTKLNCKMIAMYCTQQKPEAKSKSVFHFHYQCVIGASGSSSKDVLCVCVFKDVVADKQNAYIVNAERNLSQTDMHTDTHTHTHTQTDTFYITFSNLADAFVQSDVQGREQSS